jgi:hypothetical protein
MYNYFYAQLSKHHAKMYGGVEVRVHVHPTIQ